MDPIIWFINDLNGNRLSQSVAHTRQEAEKDAAFRFAQTPHVVIDSGKRKPPGACCNKCGDHPCGSL